MPQIKVLTEEERFDLEVVGRVLPFRVNNYVTDELIDWSAVPDDPIFQLTFMQKGMLESHQYDRMADALRKELPKEEIDALASEIRLQLNPHPAGQMTANVPILDEEPVPGLQHKYRETCLVFPSNGQTCHAYCTFCFRWPQFVGMTDLKFATDESNRFQDYLRDHREVTDVLLTGGDPMIMSARNLRTYIEPLLGEGFEHIQTIRIGTKSLSYWPYRYLADKDSDEVLALFERVIASGKHLALMAHFSHWIELGTPAVKEAIRRIRSTGAEIRTQSPLIKHINDDADVWVRMWQEQVRLGCIPYYMFVERETGAKNYFEVPLWRALDIYRNAIQRVSGLARTARGPSMSAFPGKVAIDGIAEVRGEKLFVLRFLQARDPDYVKRPFFAKFDPDATWFTELRPAFGRKNFFFEQEETVELEETLSEDGSQSNVLLQGRRFHQRPSTRQWGQARGRNGNGTRDRSFT
ncbi:MAG: lysine 2,3-aminomutase [Candidatus Latescibacterota bacterium]